MTETKTKNKSEAYTVKVYTQREGKEHKNTLITIHKYSSEQQAKDAAFCIRNYISARKIPNYKIKRELFDKNESFDDDFTDVFSEEFGKIQSPVYSAIAMKQ